LCEKKKIEFSVFFVVFKIQKSRGRNMKVGDGGRKGRRKRAGESFDVVFAVVQNYGNIKSNFRRRGGSSNAFFPNENIKKVQWRRKIGQLLC
jgi:hypothetical protein